MASTVTLFAVFTFVFASFSSTPAVGSNLAYPASTYYNLNPAPYSPVVWPQTHYFNYHPASASVQQRQLVPYQFEYDAQTALANRAGPILTLLNNFCQGVYSGPTCPICPVCNECANTCPTCSAAPPISATLTTCTFNGISSSSPTGIIQVTGADAGNSCFYTFATFSPYTKMQITCPTSAGVQMYDNSGDEDGGEVTDGSPVTSTGINLNLEIKTDGSGAVECTWKAII